MKTFLAVFTGAPDAMAKFAELDEATRKDRSAKGMEAWKKWGADHAERIVYSGGPLGKTKKVGPNGIADIRNAMAAFTIVKAASHEDAAAMFAGHAHFTLFPGDGVEVMECLPAPDKPRW